MYTTPNQMPDKTNPSQFGRKVVTSIVALIVLVWFIPPLEVVAFGKRFVSHPLSFVSKKYEARYYVDLAKPHIEREEWLDALMYLSTAIQLYDTDAEAFYQRAFVYHRINVLDDALSDLNRAISIDGEYAEAYHERGWIYDTLGNDDLALLDYSKSISLKPEFFDPYVARGSMFFEQGKWREVIDDMTQALALLPDSLTSYQVSFFFQMRGLAYLNLDQISECVADFNQSLDVAAESQEQLHRYLPALNDKLKTLEPTSEDYVQLESLIATINGQ